MIRLALSLLGLFLFVGNISTAKDSKFKAPWLSGPVIDEAGILTPQHKADIERMLYSFNQRGMAQVQVYITSSLQGLQIEQASIDIADQWKLGTKEKDNGLLFLIAPNEKKLRIEVGQGLEGIMPDVYAKRITEDVVVPYFKQGQLSEGVYQGVKAIFAVLDGEELRATAKPESAQDRKISLPFWVIIPLWILIIFLGRIGGGRRRFRDGMWIGGGGFGGFGGGGGGGWSGGGGGFSGGGSSSSW
jgi:uncharacterized protein